MLRRGLFRVWAMVSAVWLFACVAAFAFVVYRKDTCYRVFTTSHAQDLPQGDIDLISQIDQALNSKPFCGAEQNSSLLTLETKAQQGAVTQISFQWLEPSGWSGDNATIEILNGKDIQLSTVRSLASGYVLKARRRANYWILAIGVAAPVAGLLLGIGAFWVAAGFRSSNKPRR